MHILFLTDNFPPESNAPASRTYEHAKEWVASGHKVTVITCAPNFPTGKLYEGYRNKIWQSEELSGIRVIRVWSYMTKNEGFALRILDYMSFMITSFVASLFVRKPDVIVGTSPQFFTSVAAWSASALKRKPFVFELRDIWPESIRAVGAMEESRVLDLLEKLELFLYRRASAIISVTKSFRSNLMERGIDGEKIHVITNGVDLDNFQPIPRDDELEVELDLTDCFVAGYIGTHGMAHALETLLEAAQILKEDPQTMHIRLVLLGPGAARDRLITQAYEMEVDNVLFLDPVPKSEITRYWSLLDVSLIHLKASDLFSTVIPSKMFECMGMGIPILMGVRGEAADILSKSGAGKTFEPENAEELAMFLKLLSSDPVQLENFSISGRRSAHLFDRKNLAIDMQKILSSLVK